MTVSNSDLTKAVIGEIHALLKPRGFRKSGPTFTRDAGATVQIVNVQKSTASDATHIKVTVNLGVWLKVLAPIRAGVSDKEDIWSSHWRVRVGSLGHEGTDRWWLAGTLAEAVAAGRELADRVVTLALPQLERLSTPEAFVQLWESGRAPGLTNFERERNLKKLLGGAA